MIWRLLTEIAEMVVCNFFFKQQKIKHFDSQIQTGSKSCKIERKKNIEEAVVVIVADNKAKAETTALWKKGKDSAHNPNNNKQEGKRKKRGFDTKKGEGAKKKNVYTSFKEKETPSL